MAGYCGYSMSNNAVDAYNNGEKPISKWKKQAILSGIKELDIDLKCDFAKLKKAPAKVLKDLCLYQSSWHHTSSYYNETDFYAIDDDKVAALTDEEINETVELSRIPKEKPTKERWICEYLEWYGTRNYPRCSKYVSEGTVRGNWFYLDNGHRKSILANGFRFIERIA